MAPSAWQESLATHNSQSHYSSLKINWEVNMLQSITSLLQVERPLKSYATIEPGIVQLVAAMNRTGLMRTYASCEGHWYRAMRPYVAFEASIQIGREFARLLREDPIAQPSQLLYEWCLEPCFNQDYDLRFRLSCSQLEFQYYWRPARLRHDIEALASMVQTLGIQGR